MVENKVEKNPFAGRFAYLWMSPVLPQICVNLQEMLVLPEAPAPGLPFPAVSTAALGASKCEGLRFEASPPNPVLPCVGGILLFQGP